MKCLALTIALLLAIVPAVHAGAIRYDTELESRRQPGRVPLYSLEEPLESVRFDFRGVGGGSFYAPWEPFTGYTLAPVASVNLFGPGFDSGIGAGRIAPTTVVLDEPAAFVFPGFRFAGSWTYTTDLDRFIGIGQIWTQVGGNLGFHADVPYEVAFNDYGSFQGGLTVTYTYTGGVPEPSSIVLLSIAIVAGLGAVASTRRMPTPNGERGYRW